MMGVEMGCSNVEGFARKKVTYCGHGGGGGRALKTPLSGLYSTVGDRVSE